jgi:tetratricopeptide (TPR) repeat protein
MAGGEYAAAATSSLAGLEMRERIGGRKQERVGAGLSQMGNIAMERGRWDEAEKYHRRAGAVFREVKGELYGSVLYEDWRVSDAFERRGDFAGSAREARESVARARAAIGADADSAAWLALAHRLRFLAERLDAVPGLLVEVEATTGEALAIQRQHGTGDAVGTASVLVQVGWTKFRSDDRGAAERAFREALGLLRPNQAEVAQRLVASATNGLAMVLTEDGALDEATSLLEESHACTRKFNSRPSWTVWLSGLELARVERLRGEVARAEALEDELCAMIARAPVRRSESQAARLVRVGRTLMEAGRLEHAEAVLAEGERSLADTGPEYWTRFEGMSLLGECIAARQEFARAEPLLETGAERLIIAANGPVERTRQAIERAVKFFEAWEKAEPGKGHGEKAAPWRARLDAMPPVGPKPS